MATIQPRPSRASGAPGRSRAPTRAVQEDFRSAFMTLPAGRAAEQAAAVPPLDASPTTTLQAKRLTVDDLRAAGVAVPPDYEAPARGPVNPADFEAEETLKPVRASAPSAPTPVPTAFTPVPEAPSQTKLVALPPMQGDPSQTLVARGPRPATMPPPAPHPMQGVVYGAAPQTGAVHGAAPFTLQPLDTPRSPSKTPRWLVPVILLVTAVVAATLFLLAATRA